MPRMLRVLILLAGLLLFAGLATACGGDGDEEAEPTATARAEPEVPEATPTEAAPTYSEVLKTYPEDAVLCATEADLLGVDADGALLTGTIELAGGESSLSVESDSVTMVGRGESGAVIYETSAGGVVRVSPVLDEDGLSTSQFGFQCYGAKITVRERVTLEGKTYQPGTVLTVDKDLHWVEVSIQAAAAPASASPFDSFHYTVDMEFTISQPGEEEGTLISVSVEGDFVAPDSHAFTSRFEFAGLSGTEEVVIIGDDAWFREGSGDWRATSRFDPDVADAIDLTSADADFLFPEEFAEDLAVLESEPETIEGVDTLRYYIPKEAVDTLVDLLGEDFLADAAGLEEFEMTVWLEEETGALVRAEFTAIASPELLNGGVPFDLSPDARLSITMSIRLTNINDPGIGIEPPI